MIFKNLILKNIITKYSHFIWVNDKNSLQFVKNFKTLNIDLIIGIDSQKKYY